MGADPGREYVLTLSCPDKPGIDVRGVQLPRPAFGEHPGQPAVRGEPGRPVLHAGALPPAAPPGRPAEPPSERGFSWVAEAFHVAWPAAPTWPRGSAP